MVHCFYYLGSDVRHPGFRGSDALPKVSHLVPMESDSITVRANHIRPS